MCFLDGSGTITCSCRQPSAPKPLVPSAPPSAPDMQLGATTHPWLNTFRHSEFCPLSRLRIAFWDHNLQDLSSLGVRRQLYFKTARRCCAVAKTSATMGGKRKNASLPLKSTCK